MLTTTLIAEGKSRQLALEALDKKLKDAWDKGYAQMAAIEDIMYEGRWYSWCRIEAVEFVERNPDESEGSE